jgi:hypothetical protein
LGRFTSVDPIKGTSKNWYFAADLLLWKSRHGGGREEKRLAVRE